MKVIERWELSELWLVSSDKVVETTDHGRPFLRVGIADIDALIAQLEAAKQGLVKTEIAFNEWLDTQAPDNEPTQDVVDEWLARG